MSATFICLSSAAPWPFQERPHIAARDLAGLVDEVAVADGDVGASLDLHQRFVLGQIALDLAQRLGYPHALLAGNVDAP